MKLKAQTAAVRLAVGVILVNLFVLALAGFVLYQSRQQYEHVAVITTQNLARTLAANVTGVIEKIDVGLFAVANEVERQMGSGIDKRQLNAYLANQKAQIRDFEDMWVADEAGDIQWGTNIPAGKPVNISDRDYFHQLHDDANSGLAISKPVIGRVTKTWSVLLSRRINHADGSFAGVALGSLRVMEYFAAMFSTIDVGKQGVIGLRDDQMALIVRYPQSTAPNGQPGARLLSTKAVEAIRTNPNSGSYKAVGAVDNIEQIFSYQQVAGYPLYIFVAHGTVESLAPWRREAAITLSMVLLFIVMTFSATWISYKRTTEMLSRLELERRKNELESLVEERTRELAQAKEAAEEGLQNERIVMAAIVESSDDAIVGMTLDGIVTTWNRGAERTFGYLAHEMVGESIFKLVPAPRRGEEQKVLETIKRGESVVYYETERICKGGRQIDIAITVSAIHDKQGRIVGASKIGRDITERKRAAQKLIESEFRWKFAIEGAGDGLWDWDIPTNKVFFSQRWKEMLGYREDEIGNDLDEWKSRVHPDDQAHALSDLQAHLDGKTATYVNEHRIHCKDGSWKWILDHGAVVSRDAQGRPLRAIGIHTDITARLSAEAKFRAIVEQSLMGVYLIDGTTLIYANPHAAAIFGYVPGELEGCSFLPLVEDEAKARMTHAIERLMRHEVKSVRMEYKALRKDGTSIVVGTEAIGTELAGSPVLIGVIDDITARVYSEEQIRKYVAQLETAFMSTVKVATTLGEMRDPYTAGHQRRVAEIAVAIGAELGFDARQQEGLRVAGYLHDIGKIAIPSEILNKPGLLSSIEHMMVKEHAKASYDVLKDVEFPWPVAQVALQHHERMDGSGYPQGLKGEAILLEARVIAVADVIEAMSSHRPYRAALGIDNALIEIERGIGTLYDAAVVHACLKLFREKGYTLPE